MNARIALPILILAALAALSHPTPAASGPWGLPPGEWHSSLEGSVFSSTSSYDIDGARVVTGRVVEKLMPWGDYKDVVTYKGIDSYTRKWGDCYGYGGLWLQNATEAICRDLLAEAMLRFEAKGFPVILTVHDEVVCEPPLGFGTVENFESEMCVLPGWAEGFPVAASGFEGARYHK